MLRENESLIKLNERLTHEKEFLLKNKDLADGQLGTLTRSLEALQKDLKDKESLVLLPYCNEFFRRSGYFLTM